MKTKRYGYIGMNGEYFVYDRKNHNIPLGYGYMGGSKKSIIKIISKLNKGG